MKESGFKRNERSIDAGVPHGHKSLEHLLEALSDLIERLLFAGRHNFRRLPFHLRSSCDRVYKGDVRLLKVDQIRVVLR